MASRATAHGSQRKRLIMSGFMRGKGEGTVETGKHGKHRGRVMLDGKVVVGPWVIRKADAISALRQKLASQDAASDPGQPLSIFARGWLQTRLASQLSPTTKELNRLMVQKLEASMLANRPINAITATEVARWQNTLPGGAYSRRNASATLNLILKVIIYLMHSFEGTMYL
jgi:hypothetical protein